MAGETPGGERRGTALVTGASAGIGRELARTFAREGYDVVLVARREGRLRALADALEGHGVAAHVVATDLTDEGAPADLLATLAKRGVEPTVLVNSAGVGVHGPVAEGDLDAESRQLRLNVAVPMELTHRFLDRLEGGAEGERGPSTDGPRGVLNVGSVAGFVPGPYMAGYYASKAHVNHFSEALAVEHRDSPLTVTVVCPGPVDTEFHERAGVAHSAVGKRLLYDPERVARAAHEGFAAGETMVVPGLAMKALVALERAAPRSLVRWAVGRLNAGR